MDISKIAEKITKRTKAIIPVHTYGHPVDMNPLLELAKEHNLTIIEDAAEAHGAEYRGKRIGSFGDAAAFSFYANKIITTGEGGMVVTNNEKIAQKARLLRNHAFTKKRFIHDELGFNYRMTNIQAAIGMAQMEYADRLMQARIDNAQHYDKLLKDVKEITLPPKNSWAKNVYWMYGILVQDEFGLIKDELMAKLQDRGIQTRSFFYPMNKQKVYVDLGISDPKEPFPVSEELFQKGLYLPSASNLGKEKIQEIVKAIKKIRNE